MDVTTAIVLSIIMSIGVTWLCIWVTNKAYSRRWEDVPDNEDWKSS